MLKTSAYRRAYGQYFTSEPVGKNVLHYDPIPGQFAGCVPISEVGNVSWTR